MIDEILKRQKYKNGLISLLLPTPRLSAGTSGVPNHPFSQLPLIKLGECLNSTDYTEFAVTIAQRQRYSLFDQRVFASSRASLYCIFPVGWSI